MSHKVKENHVIIASQNILSELGRLTAGSYYDHQEVRITEMNRIRDIIYRKIEGLGLVEVQEKKEEKDYSKKYTDKQLIELWNKAVSENKVSEEEKHYMEKVMEVQKNAEKFEQMYKGLMMDYVESQVVYKEFLEKIKGISAVLSANLLKEFGYCENAPYISSIWKYSGMHVVEGKSPKRKRGEKLDFNLKIRTMVWKIGDSFIKQRTPFYRDIYDSEKKIQESKTFSEGELFEKYGKPYKKEDVKLSKGHIHSRATRKMIKIFLAHYWQACKELSHRNKENQVVIAKPYVAEKLGHEHISNWKDAVLAQVKKKADDKIANALKKTTRK